MTASADKKLLDLCKQLDAAGTPTPDTLTLLEDDGSLYLSQFQDIKDALDMCSDSTKEGLTLFCEELLAIKDRRLYDFSVYKTLELEIGAAVEGQYVELSTDDETGMEMVEYILSLPSDRHPTMHNSLAHEAGHNLDISHFPDGLALKEVNVHSTNPLLNTCFDQDLRSHPDGLAQHIDTILESRNYTHDALMKNGMTEGEAAKRFQEERFAVMMELYSTNAPKPASPLLDAYHDIIVDFDLKIGTEHDPQHSIATKREALADALTKPVAMLECQALDSLRDKATGAHSRKALQPKIQQAERQLESSLIKAMTATRHGLEAQFNLPPHSPRPSISALQIAR